MGDILSGTHSQPSWTVLNKVTPRTFFSCRVSVCKALVSDETSLLAQFKTIPLAQCLLLGIKLACASWAAFRVMKYQEDVAGLCRSSEYGNLRGKRKHHRVLLDGKRDGRLD